MYAGYRAIAVDAYKEGRIQANLYQIYLSQLRALPWCECEKAPVLELRLVSPEYSRRKCPRHRCQLFAVNGGRGIYIPPSNNPLRSTSKPIRYNDSTNYSFVLASDGCERMDDCISQLENEIGLKERELFLGYSDTEIRFLIRSNLR
jgi:hypothetical protein